jgi:periplasmic divalent cation tolerance protein
VSFISGLRSPAVTVQHSCHSTFGSTLTARAATVNQGPPHHCRRHALAIIDIWINCPDEAVADRIAENLIDRRLVACANLYPAIRSVYRWQGGIARESEVPLLVKTRAELFDAVEKAVRANHPYETPSIIGLAIARVNADYRDWVFEETGGADRQ